MPDSDEYVRYVRYANVYLIFLLAVGITGGLSFLRYLMAGPFAGTRIYDHLTLARHIADTGVPTVEPLRSVTRPYLLDAYDLIIALFPDLTVGVMILTIIVAILLPPLFYVLLTRLGASRDIRALGSLFLMISPAYLALVLSPHGEALGVLILVVAALLQTYNPWFAAPVYLIVPLFGPMHTILAVFTVILIWQFLSHARLGGIVNLVIIIIPSLLFFGLFFYRFGFMPLPSFDIGSFFSDMGSASGFGMFAIILALIGFYVGWAEKRRMWSVFLMGFVFLIVSGLTQPLLIAFALPFSLAAAIGTRRLMVRAWHIPDLKGMTMLLMACGLLFSSVSFIDEHMGDMPDNEVWESLSWISGRGDTGHILTHSSYAPWVRYMAGRTPVLDPFVQEVKPNRHQKIEALFQSRNIHNVQNISRTYGIRTLYITPEMKDGLVWNRDDQGLLFLLRNNETFSKVYGKDNIEIWRIQYADDGS